LVSQRESKRIEEIFAWLKMIGLLPSGSAGSAGCFSSGGRSYNLVRMRSLAARPT
jgi:hypothetical protein